MPSPLINRLIDAFTILPGVGPKSAQRMTYQLLERNRAGGEKLAQALLEAIEKVGRCQMCRDLSEAEICAICSDSRRDNRQLCIVENPTDVLVIEQSGIYKGVYFVLMGHLSPIDGIGPAELGLDSLKERFDAGLIHEVILATNPTVEGEATAHYIQNMAKKTEIEVSRLAQGIPMGGELEFIDSGTLSQAFVGRKSV